MNGTSVFFAACATVANCSASRKPSAAMSRFVPVFSTRLSRFWSSGVSAGMCVVVVATVAAAAADVSCGRCCRLHGRGGLRSRRGRHLSRRGRIGWMRPERIRQMRPNRQTERESANERHEERCDFAYCHHAPPLQSARVQCKRMTDSHELRVFRPEIDGPEAHPGLTDQPALATSLQGLHSEKANEELTEERANDAHRESPHEHLPEERAGILAGRNRRDTERSDGRER